MYLQQDGRVTYAADGSQRRSGGLFLMLVQPVGVAGCAAPIKACVRRVALQQCGCWMLGRVKLYGESCSVSGAYGADGLTMGVSQVVYDRLPVALPLDLVEAWNKGEGWNSAGREGPAIRAWALENLDSLRK